MMQNSKLKEVSKAKHHILQKYFPTWIRILGSTHQDLFYVDCFAGKGKYQGGELGSPLIVFQKARDITWNRPYHIHLIFVEKDKRRAEQLEQYLYNERSNPKLSYEVFSEDSRNFTKGLLDAIPYHTPVFFFIDPYGHPISIPTINKILQRPRSEVFLNLMWFRINMDLNNPTTIKRLNQMFGHSDWSKQSFLQKKGKEREEGFLEYFCSQVHSKYHFHFRIRFDPKDKTPGGSKRTKYYLIHFCNHPKAVLLMKNVMWKLGDEEGTFDYSAKSQGVLFSSTPTEGQLIEYLKKNYLTKNKSIEFMQLRIDTYQLPFLEKHYRGALKKLEADGLINIERKVSKRSGIRDSDFINFN